MNEISVGAASVKRKQYLLVGVIVAAVLAVSAAIVSTTDSIKPTSFVDKPIPVNVMAPGTQSDPRDQWVASGAARLSEHDQQLTLVQQKVKELQGQLVEAIAAAKATEALNKSPLGAIPNAPPPYGVFPPGSPQLLGAQPARVTTLPEKPTSMAPAPAVAQKEVPLQSPIMTVSMRGSSMAADSSVTQSESSADLSAPVVGTGNVVKIRNVSSFIPSGSFARGALLAGLDAPTGGQAQSNPQPVLIRLGDDAVLPNRFRSGLKECFVVAAGYGSVSSERAYLRLETLSCVFKNGNVLDVPVSGWVNGEDGKNGLRGKFIEKTGAVLQRALLAGIASGIGSAFSNQSTITSVSALGQTQTTTPGQNLKNGLGKGIGNAMDRLADYYIRSAETLFPIIEVDAGRAVEIVLTKGIELEGFERLINPTALDQWTMPRQGHPLLNVSNTTSEEE